MSQVSQQLPAFCNEDYGLLLFGLASLAQPLPPPLLARLCRESHLKLEGMSGEGLGLLVWGLAQYGYDYARECGGGHSSSDDSASSRRRGRSGRRGGDGDADAAPVHWWDDVYAECSAKWSSAGLRGCGLLAVGLAQLAPSQLPPGEWESDWVDRYKAVVPGGAKPRSWEELVVGLRAASGLEPGEALPAADSPWLCGLLLRLGKSWGMQEPTGGGGIAAVVDSVNARVASTAALFAAGGVATAVVGDSSGSSAGGSTAEVGLAVADSRVGAAGGASASDGGDVDGDLGSGGDVEPTSATAVLL